MRTVILFIDHMQIHLPLLDRMYKERDSPSEELKKLRENIKDADRYVPITLEYNHSISSALKNTLAYFLEEYFFKPSAIASYSVGSFGGINAAQHLRQIFAELGAPSVSSSFQIPQVHKVFDNDGKLLDDQYNTRVKRFLDEFDWYVDVFRNQRQKGIPY